MAGTIYVNSAYTADAELGEGKSWGVNAFATLKEAIAAKTSATEEFVVESNIDGDEIASLGGLKITTNVEGGVTINNTYDNWVYVSGNTNIGAGVTINSGYYFYYGEGNEISGKLVASGQNYQRYDDVITINPGGLISCLGEAFVIRYNNENGSKGGFRVIGDAAEGAALADRTVQFNGSYYSFYSGTIDASDTLITGGAIWMNNATDGQGYKAVAKLDNTIWTSTGNLVMNGDATITLDNGSILQVSNFDGYGASSLDATSVLNVNDSTFIAQSLVNNGKITVSGDSTLTLGAYEGTGTLTIDLTGYTGRGGKIVDMSQDDWSKDYEYTVKGLAEGPKYSVEVKEGDLVLIREETEVELDNGKLDLSADGAVAKAGDNASPIGTVDADMMITTDGADVDVSHLADIKSDIVGADITLVNTKDLLIKEGKSISAKGSATITNGKEVAADGAPEAKLTGKIQAGERINFTNNGHAEVELSAKDMIIANNSLNTLSGSIGDSETNSIVITTGSVDKNGIVTVDPDADGTIENAVITATSSVDIENQTVTNTTFATHTLNVFGDSNLGTGNSYSGISAIEFGSDDKEVNATIDVTNVSVTNFCVQNGTVTLTGKMADGNSIKYLAPGAYFTPPLHGDGNGSSSVMNIGTVENTDAHVNISQFMLDSESEESGITHTLNVYGTLTSAAGCYAKVHSIVNIYNDVKIKNYFQAAGISVTVSGAETTLDVVGSATQGIAIGGKMEKTLFTITDDATVVTTLVAVGNNDVRHGDLKIANGGSLKADTLTLLEGGSTITIDASTFEEGVWKALDLTMSEADAAALQEKVTVTGLKNEAWKKTYKDGDIYFINVDTSKLYVNSAYTGDFGDDLGDGKYFGVNAFAALKDAVAAAENGAKIEVSGEGVIVSKADLNGKDVTITGTAVFDWEQGSIMVGEVSDEENEIATLTFEDAKISTIDSNKGYAMSGGINIRTPKKGNPTPGKGVVYIKGNSEIELSYLLNNNEMYVVGTGSMKDTPTLTVYGGFKVAGRTADDTPSGEMSTAVMEITEGAFVKVQSHNGMGVGCEGTGILNVYESRFESDSAFLVELNGTVNIRNGVFVMNNGLTNKGTINVSGTSTLDIENMIGTIVAADGATLNNSVIKGGTGYESVEQNGYKYVLSVNGDKAGTLNFAGTNTIQNIEAGAGDIVNVKNATLNFVSGSDGFKLGNGATWNIENANVGGAWALSLDGAYMTDDENAPVSTLNAKGSTFTLQQISAKGTKDGQEIGYGTFNVNFADSDVILSNRLQIQKQETATVNIKFAENSTLTALHLSNFSTKGTVTFNASNAKFTQNFGNIGKVNVENGAVLSATYGSSGAGLVLDNGAYAEKSNGNSGTITVNGGTMSLTSAGALSTFTNSGTIAVIGGTFSADSLTNSGTMTVSGESTVKGAFTGNGWVYMNGASLDSNTEITGANVRFASGDNVVDGATIDNGRFQVGTGTYQASDEMVDTKNGVTVTVKNNAHIEGIDGSLSPYGGWVGSEYYSSQDDKTAAMTDARYTLNIENSIADFGYMHVSHDGIMNVTGNADNLETIGGVDYTFRAGTLNINGVVTFDSSIAAVIGTGVSVDNQTDNPGKLIITNGAVYNAAIDDKRYDAKFTIYEKGIVEVNNEGVLKIGTLVNFSSNGELNITDRGTVESVVAFTNNGAITVDSTSLLKAEDITMGDSATITLNVAEDFSGYHKFIDLDAGDKYAADEDLDVNFDVDVEDLGLTVIHSNDGDVALVKVDDSNLFVDTTWADVAEGSPVSIDDVVIENMLKDFNAFSSMTAALTQAEENMANLEEGKVTIEVMANTEAMGEAYDISTAGTYVITGGSGENIGEVYATADDIDIVIDNANIAIEKISAGETSDKNLWLYPNLASLSGSDITITNSVVYGVIHVNESAYMTTVGNSVVTIENSVVGRAADGVTHSQAMMTFSSGGEVNMTSSEFYSGLHFSITDRGVATLDGTTLYADTLNVGYAPVNDETLLRRNSNDFAFSSSGDYRKDEVGAVAEVILTNGSLISSDHYWGNGNESNGIRIGGGDGNVVTGYTDTQAGKLTVKDNSKIVLTNTTGSAAKNNITLAANGTLLVSDGGYVETIGVVTNAGTITLDGTDGEGNAAAVTFKANEVVNNGTFTVSGESTLNISKLTGNVIQVSDAVLTADITGGDLAVQSNTELKNVTVSGGEIWVSGLNTDGSVAKATVTGTVKHRYGIIGGTDANGNMAKYFKDYTSAAGGQLEVAKGAEYNADELSIHDKGTLTIKGKSDISCAYVWSKTGALNVEKGGSFSAVWLNVYGEMNVAGTVKTRQDDYFRTVTINDGGKLNVSGLFDHGGAVVNNGTITLDGTEETVTFKANKVDNNGTFTVSGASLDITDLTVDESATFSIGTVYAEGEKDIASTNTVNIDGFTGNITLTDDAVIAEGSEIRTTGGTITVADDATLYWGAVSGATITVGEDLAFDGVNLTDGTVYDGKVTWGNEFDAAEQDLIINGVNVVWDTAAAAAETTDKTGTVIDAEGNIYNITVGDNSITAERKKTESGEDATVEELALTDVAVARGTESAYYMITVNATAVGGSKVYEWSLDVDGEKFTPDYSEDKLTFTFDSKAFAADGKVDISVTVKDGYGTTVTKEIDTITAWDKDAPSIGDVTFSTSNWTKDNVTLSITPKDQGGSGISSVLWVIGDGDNQESDNLTGDDKGVYSLEVSGNTKGYFLVHDWAGNSSKETFEVVCIDKQGIVISVEGYESDVWTNKDVTFTVTATKTDSTTSVYAVVGETQTKVENGSFTVSDEGESTVKFIANNQAGTKSESSEYVVKIDKVLPILEDFSYKLQNGNIVVSYKSSDDRSGVAKVEFIVDGEKVEESTALDGAFSYAAGNSFGFQIAVYDNAGNVYTSDAQTVKISSPGAGGSSEVAQDLHIGHHFTEEELYDLRNNYAILPEGESQIIVQKGYKAVARGFGKENGKGANNIVLAKGASLEVLEGIDNLGDVSVGKYGQLTILFGNEGGLLEAASGKQAISMGKGTKLHVCGDLDLGDGDDYIGAGKYGQIEICGELTTGAGNDSVALGKGGVFNAGSLDFGAGNDYIGTGKYGQINVDGAFEAGAGNDSVALGKGGVFNAGSVNFGAGNDYIGTGKYGQINVVGAFEAGAGNDSVALGKGGLFNVGGNASFGDGNDSIFFGKYASMDIAGNLDFGGGTDALYLGKGNSLNIDGKIIDLERISGGYGSITSGGEFEFEDISGLVSLFQECGEVSAGTGTVEGALYSCERDIYQANGTLDLDFGSTPGVDVEIWSNGSWKDLTLVDGVATVMDGTRFSVGIDSTEFSGKMEKKSYEFTLA